MTVLCDAWSVIIRRDSIDNYFKGGWTEFLETIPNNSFCTDGELARVGFKEYPEAQKYIETLEAKGLQFVPKKKLFGIFGKARKKDDIHVIHQVIGPTWPCNWIEFGKFPAGPNEIMVSMCWLFEGPRFGLGVQMDSPDIDLSIPEGWTPEESKDLLQAYEGAEDAEIRYEFVKSENDMDVYWDKDTESEVAIAELR